MRWLMIAVTVVALALFGVGCGGGDESAADTDTTTITETTETDETTTDETTTDETTDGTETGISSIFTSEDCLAFIGAAAAVGQAFAGASADVDQSEFFEEYADRVPDEIKADLQTMADVGAAAAAAYTKLDLAPGETPSAAQLAEYQQALAAIDQEEYTAAAERISAWTNEVCPGG